LDHDGCETIKAENKKTKKFSEIIVGRGEQQKLRNRVCLTKNGLDTNTVKDEKEETRSFYFLVIKSEI
jgi:hypothetical protein